MTRGGRVFAHHLSLSLPLLLLLLLVYNIHNNHNAVHVLSRAVQD